MALATAVRAMEIITGNGDVLTFSQKKLGDKFPGAVVGLGALGVITRITLEVQPTFQMIQVVYENLAFSQLERHLDEIFASGYSVSLFTDWQNHRATQVWIKRRVDQGPHAAANADFYGATPATRNLHPLAGHSAESCTEQMGVPGPWYERLPHFRMNFTPSSGAELQSEYFVPRERGYAAINAVEQLRDQLTPHLFISEFRSIAADDLWISPCYQRASTALHFTWKPEWSAVKKVLPLIEEKLAPFGARPIGPNSSPCLLPISGRTIQRCPTSRQCSLNTIQTESFATNLSAKISMVRKKDCQWELRFILRFAEADLSTMPELPERSRVRS
jgi:alditol oxidase